LQIARDEAPPGVEVTIFDGLRDLPLFDPTLDPDALPAVGAWRQALASSDAVLIATPEYGHSLPGSLKNAIDWVIGSGELERKVVAITAAVPGPDRGHRGLKALRDTLGAVSARVVGGYPIVKGANLASEVGRLLNALLAELRPRRHSYMFADVDVERELARLQSLEKALDPASRRVLRQTPLTAGWSCLEVGAGAGSIANFLAEKVGPDGCVTALDLVPRFLHGRVRPGVRVVEGDIREFTEAGRYDLVHTRYVLGHLPEVERALDRIATALRPEGWLVLEEMDFLASRFAGGSPENAAAFERVNAAIRSAFTGRGVDPGLGVRLPAIAAAAGFTIVSVEAEAHLARGGSEMARMMRESTEQLRAKYVATGAADDHDVDGYRRFAEDPAAWGVYYATVRVVARR
jgi:NAD(P)H-dependent FMN reductase/2-polyprenyl-3-methyl-5-hydroxy-6-metoxy-1,4-benzoquinol methylase